MLVSIFTPTHSLAFLGDAAQSIHNLRPVPGVTVEWLVGVNGGLKADSALDAVLAPAHDSLTTVVVFECPKETWGSVGALKRHLCDSVDPQSELLIELDHDDMLARQAIQVLVMAYRQGADLIYSSGATFHESTLQGRTFSTHFGWTSYKVRPDMPGTRIHNIELDAQEAFEPSAQSFSQILWAPDHVRAWSRKCYVAAGGHDPSLKVADDYDLLCRSFLVAEKIVRIPECLYFYRLRSDGGNTWLQNVWEIQRLCGQGVERYPNGQEVPAFAQPLVLRDKYLHQMVEREGVVRGLPMYDLGGALGCPPGWISVDRQGGDLHHDLVQPLPFADSSVWAFRAFDVLEHLPPEAAARLIAEMWRCLVPGGWILSQTPADSGVGAACDLSHASRWNTRTWAYFYHSSLMGYREQAFPGMQASFHPVRVFETDLVCGPGPCQWTIPYVIADLVAIKGDMRYPGPHLL